MSIRFFFAMKKSILIIAITLLTGLFSGAAADEAMRTLTDPVGRKVTVPGEPSRIISLAPSITEMIFSLGQSGRLVGVTQFSDYPPEASRFPKVGSYIRLDLERIIALRPDLCIANRDGNPKAAVDRLSEFGIPVFAVDPRDLESVMETILVLGNLLHAEDRADSLVEDMRQRIDRITRKVEKAEHRPKIFFQIGVSPIVSAGRDTFIHRLIEMAGGTNIARDSISYPRFSREQVLAMRPEIIIITSMARKAVFEEVRREWEKWSNLPAVQTGRVYLQDSNLFDRPSPRLIDGLELLAKLIHPELFDVDGK